MAGLLMRCGGVACVAIAAFFGFVLSLTAAAELEPDGWRRATWDMTAADLDRHFGERLTHLATPLDFGPFYADRMIADIDLGGYRFKAFLQLDRGARTLQQVLLDIRRIDAPARVFSVVLEDLIVRYGPPDCLVEMETGAGAIPVGAVWRRSGTTVQAGLIDMNDPAILTENPNIPIDVRRPRRDRQIIRRSSLPRRVTVRFHSAARADLGLGPCAQSGDDDSG